MLKIKKILAYEIIDSRGEPTIEGRLILDNGSEVTTSIPAGTSLGKYEGFELRDKDPKRFNGMGVLQAVSYINTLLGPKLIGVSPSKITDIDLWLVNADGTRNKSKLGANTCLTISQLVVKAAAKEQGVPLFRYINSLYKQIFKSEIRIKKIPTPIFNVINGGKHANNDLDFQEFQIIPTSSFTFSKALQLGVEFFHELLKVLQYRNASISVGEEGGFTPNFSTNFDALEVIKETTLQMKYQIAVDIFLGLDIAAAHFYKEDSYRIKDKTHSLKHSEYLEFILDLLKKYSPLVIEDPFGEDDWEMWGKLNSQISRETYLVGDDLIASNKERFARAVKEKSCSTILIKPNQIGTITGTMEVVDIARKNNFNYIISQRSGETNDSFIADFAVGVQSDFVKFGALYYSKYSCEL
ncbi:phosphopyruvate hydratase [Candidatus Roizmanbacteria bacterium]|nr:phosphopyruvate hydratase [Candidatus Roizmanbacteria bacterium]